MPKIYVRPTCVLSFVETLFALNFCLLEIFTSCLTLKLKASAVKTQIQHWEMGVAASDEISRKFLERSGNGVDSLSPRSYDHSLLRFKLLMGMMVWTHQESVFIHIILQDLFLKIVF